MSRGVFFSSALLEDFGAPSVGFVMFLLLCCRERGGIVFLVLWSRVFSATEVHDVDAASVCACFCCGLGCFGFVGEAGKSVTFSSTSASTSVGCQTYVMDDESGCFWLPDFTARVLFSYSTLVCFILQTSRRVPLLVSTWHGIGASVTILAFLSMFKVVAFFFRVYF